MASETGSVLKAFILKHVRMFSGLSEVDPCSDRCNWISISAELTVTSPKVLISFSLVVRLDLCMPCMFKYETSVT